MKALFVEILVALTIVAGTVLPFVRREAVKKRLPEILAGLSVFLVILILFHQRLVHNFWFRFYDLWHHESAEICFAALAAGLLLGKYLSQRNKG